jgi:hypothetical protein
MGIFIGGDGGIWCAGAGNQCCHEVEPLPAEAMRTTFAHDESMAELTRRYNDLMRPYREPREDGRVLRLVYTPDDTVMFVWATCHGRDADIAEIEKVHGPLSNSPNDLRKALGID